MTAASATFTSISEANEQEDGVKCKSSAVENEPMGYKENDETETGCVQIVFAFVITFVIKNVVVVAVAVVVQHLNVRRKCQIR